MVKILEFLGGFLGSSIFAVVVVSFTTLVFTVVSDGGSDGSSDAALLYGAMVIAIGVILPGAAVWLWRRRRFVSIGIIVFTCLALCRMILGLAVGI